MSSHVLHIHTRAVLVINENKSYVNHLPGRRLLPLTHVALICTRNSKHIINLQQIKNCLVYLEVLFCSPVLIILSSSNCDCNYTYIFKQDHYFIEGSPESCLKLFSLYKCVIPGAEPMRRPDRSAPGSFFFRMGTIFSSKYSMAIEEISLNSCRTSWARWGARVEFT